MKKREEIKNELIELSPLLWEQKNNPEGYSTPKDYFKTLPDEIIAQLNTAPKKALDKKENWIEGLIKSFQYVFQPRYAFALASFALIVVTSIFFNKQPGDGQTGGQLAASDILNEIPSEVLSEYISNNIHEFDESILEEELAGSTDISFPNFNSENNEEIMNELIEDLNVEDLEDLF